MECFFNEDASNFLQHVAITFEIVAVYLVFHDHQRWLGDARSHQRRAAIPFGTAVPLNKRSKELRIAIVIGLLAIDMEGYQLITLHWGCKPECTTSEVIHAPDLLSSPTPTHDQDQSQPPLA